MGKREHGGRNNDAKTFWEHQKLRALGDPILIRREWLFKSKLVKVSDKTYSKSSMGSFQD